MHISTFSGTAKITLYFRPWLEQGLACIVILLHNPGLKSSLEDRCLISEGSEKKLEKGESGRGRTLRLTYSLYRFIPGALEILSVDPKLLVYPAIQFYTNGSPLVKG